MISLTLIRAFTCLSARMASRSELRARMAGKLAVAIPTERACHCDTWCGSDQGQGLALAAFSHGQGGFGIGVPDQPQDIFKTPLVIGGLDVVANVEFDRDLPAKFHRRPWRQAGFTAGNRRLSRLRFCCDFIGGHARNRRQGLEIR